MKIVKMIDIGSINVGTSNDDFIILYDDFANKLDCTSIKFKHFFNIRHEQTMEEYKNSLDENKKVDPYLESGVQNELEHILYSELKGFNCFVQYAYEYLQDEQSLELREKECAMIGGRDNPNYHSSKRKRAVDMKLVLRTCTTYFHAYKDTVYKIRYKFKYD
jgi:hypothetical protein